MEALIDGVDVLAGAPPRMSSQKRSRVAPALMLVSWAEDVCATPSASAVAHSNDRASLVLKCDEKRVRIGVLDWWLRRTASRQPITGFVVVTLNS